MICRVIIAKMINRFIQTHLKNQLEIFPAVALLGARQVGKTTLALNVTAEFSKPTLYLDLERHSDVAKTVILNIFFFNIWTNL